jgi:ABC-2 type transport system permease protein/sodium transport system permease protein
MLCLALMFPASFVLSRLILEFQKGSVDNFLAAQAAGTVVLFGVFPAAAAWFARVQPLAGFRLRVPAVGACVAALLFGVCLWPFAYELGMLLVSWGFTTLSKEQLDTVKGVLAEYSRSAPVPLVLLVLGVLPGVFEELFFRGYLMNAFLKASRPRTAILTSALLFGVFHLFMAGGLAIERLPVSTLLGVVLGWLCWKSGSVLPGMLLHATHNSLLMYLGLNQEQLIDWGLSNGENEHLPVPVLLGATAGSALAAVWVALLPRPTDAADPVDGD